MVLLQYYCKKIEIFKNLFIFEVIFMIKLLNSDMRVNCTAMSANTYFYFVLYYTTYCFRHKKISIQ